ncbi:TELO2-interacting protein 1 homolog isoform X7 [Hydra vulgaris]|uniref:TELO2-interacting protein 1 homolog isoform X7 n=1 Tax=Hydra vulgaris TaxID=6087 RepID=A0ABM4BDY5_HYDVU
MADGLFYALKPICVIVAKEPNVKNLTSARETFCSLNQNAISEPALLEYVMFPFNLSLNKKLKEEEEILCFQCLTEIYYYTTSEEQRLGITVMLRMLLSKVSLSLFNVFYQKERLPLIGHVVSVLLNLVEGEKNLTLQLVALECLQLLAGFNDQLTDFAETFGDTFASFFPGVATLFNRVLVSPFHQNHRLVEACLKTFSLMIKTVLHDNVCSNDSEIKMTVLLCKTANELQSIEQLDEIDNNKKTLKIERNKKWLHKSANNIKVIFQNIFPVLMCHSHVSVRCALTSFLNILLLSCMDNLKESIPDFIVVLAKLSCDDYETVRTQSNLTLKMAQQHFQQKDRKDLQDILDEKWYSEILSLPRVISTASNDDLKCAKLQLIKGYLQFYGDGLKYLLCSYAYLDKFLCALIQILELDYTSINVVQERTAQMYMSIDASSCDPPTHFQMKTFKHYNNTVILRHIEDVIRLIAIHGDMYLLIDHLIEKYLNSMLYRIQAVLVINTIISSRENYEHNCDLNSLIELLISLYIQEDWWNLPINNLLCQNIKKENIKEDKNLKNQVSIPFETLHQNIQLISVLLEGISTFVKVMKTDFNLINVLYPILEKVGSTNTTISRIAVQTLHDIVKHCGYSNISNLILKNSDYLINSITLRFRRFAKNSAAASVLCVILKYSNSDIMSLVADAADDVFRILDFYQEEAAYEMLNVLMHLSQAVDKWFNGVIDEKEKETKKTKDDNKFNIMNNSISVEDFFTAYSEEYLHAHGFINECEIDSSNDCVNGESSFDDTVDVQKEVPIHYRAVITSMEKCVYFIAARDLQIKLKALDVTLFGVLALRKRENDLLPLLHNLWPAIIKRLKDLDMVVVLKALDVVCTMVEHSGDFMRKRMTDEFLPFVLRFLDQHVYTFTQDQSKYIQVNKVLTKLVRFIGAIIPTLNPTKKIFCNLCSSLFPYLDYRLHLAVREETVSTLQKFYLYKPDIIWLLFEITHKTHDISHKSFKPITQSQNNLYAENISKIFS